MKKSRAVLLSLIVALALLFPLLPTQPSQASALTAPPGSDQLTTTSDTSIMFIENVGQWHSDARFQVRGANGSTIWLNEDAIWLTVLEPPAQEDLPIGPRRNREPSAPRMGVNIRLSFVGANPHPELVPFDPVDTTISYFLGDDPDAWRPDVPVFGGVRYVGLLPGIDLELTSAQGIWSWRFATEVPDPDIHGLRLRVEGADAVEVKTGYLYLSTAAGDATVPLPALPEFATADLTAVHNVGNGAFELTNPFSQVPAERLPTIPDDDPSDMLFSTFIGASDRDSGYALAVDDSGNAVLSGETYSTDFPTTLGAFDTVLDGPTDVFVLKLAEDGSSLMFSTFIGGTGWEMSYDLALDDAGNAVVTGNTWSSDFPTTQGAYDTTYDLLPDAYVLKLASDGASLLYSTFIGGTRKDQGSAVCLDGAGNAVVTGDTNSPDFPTTQGAYDTTHNGDDWEDKDIFVLKLAADGSELLFSTFVGGTGWELGFDVALDDAGNAAVTGYTSSLEFPTTFGAYDTTFNGYEDVYVLKLAQDGSSLLWSTFVGGSEDERAAGLALDAAGNPVVAGSTHSSDFPTTLGAYDTTLNGTGATFVLKLSADGGSLRFSSYVGGSTYDDGLAMALDAGYNVVVTGYACSSDFPTTEGAYDRTHAGGFGDVFVLKMAADGGSLLYSTFVGASEGDHGYALALDAAGNAMVTGYTWSPDYPTTQGAYDRVYEDGESFVSKLELADDLHLPDTGFRPFPHGYFFENWGPEPLPPPREDFTFSDMVSMFGASCVCWYIDGHCQPKFAPYLWWYQRAGRMKNGRCAGMSAASLRFFTGYDAHPGAVTTYDLGMSDQVEHTLWSSIVDITAARRHVSYHQVLVSASPIRSEYDSALNRSPSQVLATLTTLMAGTPADYPILWLCKNWGCLTGSSHSLVPYLIEDQGEGKFWVKVYDSNDHGSESEKVEIDTINESWEYEFKPGDIWQGDSGSYSLGAVPVSVHHMEPDCSFGSGTSASAGAPMAEVSLSGPGHLLIRDSQGRRIGFAADVYVSEIPGAASFSPPGGLGSSIEPVYDLPLTTTYTILLDGQTLTQTQTASIAQIGPGYAAWADDVALEPDTQDEIVVASDGSALSYQAGTSKDASLALAWDGPSQSARLIAQGVDLTVGDVVALSADSGTGEMALSSELASGGEYNLVITRLSAAGEHIFNHIGIDILATDTHYFDYAAWDGHGPMILHIDHGSDGTIDETRELENQANRVYLPLILRTP